MQNKTLLLAIFFILCMCTAQAAFPTAIKLKEYYNFENVTKSGIFDASFNGRIALNNTGQINKTHCISGYCFSYGAIGRFSKNGTVYTDSFTTFTVSLWLKGTSMGGTADNSFVRSDNEGYSGTFTLQRAGTASAGNGKVVLRLYNSSVGSGYYFNLSSSALQSNKWYNVIAIFNGTHVYGFVNGTKSAAVRIPNPNKFLKNSSGLRFGYLGATVPNVMLNIDELYVFNRSITDYEAQLLFENRYSNLSLFANISTCNQLNNITYARFTSFNENFPSQQLTTDFEYSGVIYDAIGTGIEIPISGTKTNVKNFSLCAEYPFNSPFYANIFVSYTTATGFTNSFYTYRQNLSSTQLYNVSLYNSNTTSPYSQLRLTLRDRNTFNTFSNVVTKLQRYYVGEDLWRTVQMDKSGDFGQVFFNIIEESINYRLMFSNVSNYLLKSTESSTFECDSGVCSFDVLINPNPIDTTSIQPNITLTYNNQTGKVIAYFNTITGTNARITLNVSKVSGNGTVIVCTNTTTASSGTLQCSTSSLTGFVTAMVYVDYELSFSQIIKLYGRTLATVLGNEESSFWSFFIVAIVVILSASLGIGGLIAGFTLSVLLLAFLQILNTISITALVIITVIGFALMIARDR